MANIGDKVVVVASATGKTVMPSHIGRGGWVSMFTPSDILPGEEVMQAFRDSRAAIRYIEVDRFTEPKPCVYLGKSIVQVGQSTYSGVVRQQATPVHYVMPITDNGRYRVPFTTTAEFIYEFTPDEGDTND